MFELLKEGLFLATRSYGGLGSDYSGGVIGDFLNAAAEAGMFAYLLPFLLIFALVFGILNSINLFKENKMVNTIIAFTVGLMALQFDLVPLVFQDIFPRLGVGLAFLLVVIILMGVFLPKHTSSTWILFTIGAIVTLTVLYQSGVGLGFSTGTWWTKNWTSVTAIVAVIAVLFGLVAASNPKENKEPILSTFVDRLMKS